MRPVLTLRGWGVVGVAAFGLLMSVLFGTRSLPVVVGSAGVLLGSGWLVLSRLDTPAVTRTVSDYGHQGDTLRVGIDVDCDRPVAGVVRDEIPNDLDADAVFRAVVDGEFTYDLDLRRRGIYELGPTRVTVHDPFGLWTRTFDARNTSRLVVYPRIRPLEEAVETFAQDLVRTRDRERFESVREYRPGDPLRDINWKATGKSPDGLMITEYAGIDATTTVTLGVTVSGPATDEAAEAAASLAVHMLGAGIEVGLVTPQDRIEPGTGSGHRRRLLELLARLRVGKLDPEQRDTVDVSVRAPADATAVVIETADATREFTSLVAPG